MKIRKVSWNNHRKGFQVEASRDQFFFPYSRLSLVPSSENRIREAWVDEELGREAFTYVMDSGETDTVHMDHVLDYNRDPEYLRELMLHELTIEASQGVDKSGLSMREMARRLGTSAAQLYRLLDPTNYRKSVDRMLSLLHVLDCEVEIVVTQRPLARDRKSKLRRSARK